jgi:carboxylesterase type B
MLDGTYIVTDTLILNGTGGYTEGVAFMTGTNRDELAIDMDFPKEGTNVTETFAKGLVGSNTDMSGLLKTPAFAISPNPSLNEILNVTVRASTDVLYTCLEHATVYTAAQFKKFYALYSFEFNRTYNPSGYTKDHCEPPATAARPDGDPDKEYFKCHAGEQLIVFGNIKRDGLPDRDGLDVPFSRLIIDYWTSFARTRDPNPDPAYLLARGYHSTISQTTAVGKWEQAKAVDPTVRLLQWNGRHVPFGERDQCNTLGFPLDYFNNH